MVALDQPTTSQDKRIGRECSKCETILTKDNIRKGSKSLVCKHCLNKARRKHPPRDRTICKECGTKLTDKNKVWYKSKKGTKCFRAKCYKCQLAYNLSIQEKTRAIKKQIKENSAKHCKDCDVELTDKNKSYSKRNGKEKLNPRCIKCQKEKTKEYNKEYNKKKSVSKKKKTTSTKKKNISTKKKTTSQRITRAEIKDVTITQPPKKKSSIETVFSNIAKTKSDAQKLSAEEKMMQEFIKEKGVTKVTMEDAKNRSITFHDY